MRKNRHYEKNKEQKHNHQNYTRDIRNNGTANKLLNRIGDADTINTLEKLTNISKSGIINLNNIDEISDYFKSNFGIDVAGFDKVSIEMLKLFMDE